MIWVYPLNGIAMHYVRGVKGMGHTTQLFIAVEIIVVIKAFHVYIYEILVSILFSVFYMRVNWYRSCYLQSTAISASEGIRLLFNVILSQHFVSQYVWVT